MALAIGQSAPDFTLYNTEKQEVSLSELRGKTVLIHFFPLAFTDVCAAQLCSARDNMEVYARLNCTVLGISIDSIFSLGEFKKQQNLSFDLLSDFNKTTLKAYDVYLEDFVLGMHGVAKRSAVVIDKEGVIRYFEVTPTPGDQPDYQAIAAVVEQLGA